MVAPASSLAHSGQLTIQHNQPAMRFLILAAFVAVAVAETVHYHDDTFHFATLGGSSGLKRTSFQTAQQPLLAQKTITTKTYQSGGPLISAFAPQPQVVVSQPAFEQRFIVQQQQQQPILSKQIVTKTYQSAPIVTKTYQSAPLISSAVLAPAPVAQQQVIQIARPTISYEQAPAPALRQQTYAPEYQGPKWRILSQVQEVDPSGPYKYSYNTENGIQVQEEGSLIPGADGPVVAAQGSFAYTGDDGKAYSVSYIADENGFRAVGDHLPTPPPIPAEILKSLEENAASGEQYDDEGRLLQK